jgi:hypothetical protein
MGITLGGIGALVGGGSALAGLFGKGSNQAPPPPPPAYMPQNLSGADAGAYTGATNLSGLNSAAQTLPQYGQITQNLINNPYAPGAQAGSNLVGAAGIGAGLNLVGNAQSNLPYASQALQTGFDPQNALYAQQYQANNDAVNAGLAARGLATTPYGAGVQNTADQTFNTNWLQTALQRQATGANTASTLQGAAGTGTTTGLNAAGTGALLPYSTANTIGTNQQGALNSYGAYGTGATSTAQQQIADFLQYLGLGNQTAGVNNQNYANQITAQNNQFTQQQTLGKNLGSSISGLGTAMNGGSSQPSSYQTYGGVTYPQF